MALPFGYPGAAAGFPYTAGYSAPFGYQSPYVSPYSLRGGFQTFPSTYGFGSPYQFTVAQAAQAQTQAAAEKSSGIKLTYFDVTARAEVIRVALYVSGVPFEDERITNEEWEQLKPKTPFGQLPLLTVNGKVLAQAIAQLMFVGSFTGLYSEDIWERAKINEAIFLGEDLFVALATQRHASDDEKEKENENLLNKLPTLLGYVEKLLTETNTGYLAGAKLTIADLHVYVLFSLISTMFADIIPAATFDKFPRTSEFRARIAALPRIAEWNAIQEQKKKDKEAAEKAKEEAKKAEKAVEESKEEKAAEQQ